MGLFGYELTRSRPISLELEAKAMPLQPLSGRSGWWSVIREPFMGAWQRNEEVNMDTVLTFSAVFACVTLIASDIAKLRWRLVEQDDDGIWTETTSQAFSPVLRKPNHFQTRIKFIEQWIVSKLIHGNAYILKQRDRRGVVVKMYVLDPTRVTPLVATDGSVYYELKRDDMSGLREDTFTVPASEIIHDTMVSLYHPLIGVSPIYASGLAAMQGLSIQGNSNTFFSNGSNPGGVLTAPAAISDSTAARLKAYWDTNFSGDNVGKVAVLGDGLKYEAMSVNPADAQLIEQLKWTAETVCTTFHVPAYMIGVGPPPPYANVGPLLQQYYSQCLQSLITSLELTLDEGLGIDERIEGKQYGVELDIDDLIWMDAETRTKAATDSISGTVLSPDEARRKYLGMGKTPGGASVLSQQQNYSLEALAKRDEGDPFAPPPAPPQLTAGTPDEDDDVIEAEAFFGSVLTKTLEGLHAA